MHACGKSLGDHPSPLVLTRISRFICEIGPICLERAALDAYRMYKWTCAHQNLSTCPCACAGTPYKTQSVRICCKTSNAFRASKPLVYARLVPLSCTELAPRTARMDRTGCCPDWVIMTRKVLCLTVRPAQLCRVRYEAACSSLSFDYCRLAIVYLRD